MSATTRLNIKLWAIVGFMFVFAIGIMPPLYDLFCDITGLNGKTNSQPYEISRDTDKAGGAVNAELADKERTIRVQFIATNNEGMPWEFRPQVASVRVRPGEETIVNYFARNPTDKPMVARAIPSVVPYKAAGYFHKTECFCFNQQPLEAGASAELGLSFIVDKDIPKQVHTITLSYTLFDVSEQEQDRESTELAVANVFY